MELQDKRDGLLLLEKEAANYLVDFLFEKHFVYSKIMHNTHK